MKKTEPKMHFHHITLIIILILVASPLLAVNDGYIDAIQADLEEFSSGGFEPPPESTWVGSQNSQTASSGATYEKSEDFSTFLKKKFPGSFIFYSKLPKEYQSRLHQEYLTTGNLEEIKQAIFKYTSEIKEQN